MKVDLIRQYASNPTFNATMVRTIPVKTFIESTEMRKNAAEHKLLWTKIEEAVKRHPSEAFIFTSADYMYGQKNSVRGVISTTTAYYMDKNIKKTPYFAILDVWKNILDPKNKDDFHNIFGTKYAPKYQEWWNKNISPIWDELSKIY